MPPKKARRAVRKGTKPPPDEPPVLIAGDGLTRQHVKYPVKKAQVDAYTVMKPARKGDDSKRKLVVLLTDVHGWRDADNRLAADRFAFATSAVVVMPDLHRGRPFEGKGRRYTPKEYETWRKANADDKRVEYDIVSAIRYAIAEHKPSSYAIAGFSYGAGRALELACKTREHDAMTPPGPLALGRDARLAAVVAFYPTRHDPLYIGTTIAAPLCGLFAGLDEIPGARAEDCEVLTKCLATNHFIKTFHVQSFPCGHGFVHTSVPTYFPGDEASTYASRDEQEDAEAAFVVATSWLSLHLGSS